MGGMKFLIHLKDADNFQLIVFCCRIVSLCMSPVNDSFMSGSLDHSVRIWDLRVNACQVHFLYFSFLRSLLVLDIIAQQLLSHITLSSSVFIHLRCLKPLVACVFLYVYLSRDCKLCLLL